MSISINGEGGNHIKLYEGEVTDVYEEKNKVFYGGSSSKSIVSNGYISIEINGEHYYIQAFKGEELIDCSSNIIGTHLVTGSFSHIGFALIKTGEGDLKYLKVYKSL